MLKTNYPFDQWTGTLSTARNWKLIEALCFLDEKFKMRLTIHPLVWYNQSCVNAKTGWPAIWSHHPGFPQSISSKMLATDIYNPPTQLPERDTTTTSCWWSGEGDNQVVLVCPRWVTSIYFSGISKCLPLQSQYHYGRTGWILFGLMHIHQNWQLSSDCRAITTHCLRGRNSLIFRSQAEVSGLLVRKNKIIFQLANSVNLIWSHWDLIKKKVRNPTV